jgi:basic membrane lipoprotein Med (substrate-binding protein (PBP1-ABC) superfamily)
MKKIISIIAGIVIAVGVITGATINSNAQDKTMTDVKIIDDYSYEVQYNNGQKQKFKYNTELECAEEYSNTWYEIYGEEQETVMTDVKIIDDFSYEIIYADGEKTIHTFDTELECAEEYSNTWYEIYE